VTDLPLDDSFVAEHIHTLLSRDERVSAPELRVIVEHDHVHVDGVVATRERKRAITDLIREAWPALIIDDRTSIADLAAQDGIEVL
jgi:hypothetical protein